MNININLVIITLIDRVEQYKEYIRLLKWFKIWIMNRTRKYRV